MVYLKVCQCDEFLSLDRNAVSEVLSRDQLTVKCEDQVNMAKNYHKNSLYLSTFFNHYGRGNLKRTRGKKIPILTMSTFISHVGV